MSSEGSTGGGTSSKLTHMVVGKIWFLSGHWTESLYCSLAVGQRLALGSLSGVVSIKVDIQEEPRRECQQG